MVFSSLMSRKKQLEQKLKKKHAIVFLTSKNGLKRSKIAILHERNDNWRVWISQSPAILYAKIYLACSCVIFIHYKPYTRTDDGLPDV
jgi:hypothetical protein